MPEHAGSNQTQPSTNKNTRKEKGIINDDDVFVVVCWRGICFC